MSFKSSKGRDTGKGLEVYRSESVGQGIGGGAAGADPVGSLSGGNVNGQEPGNGYKYHTFTGNGTLTVSGGDAAVTILLQGGGAGGGNGVGGGKCGGGDGVGTLGGGGGHGTRKTLDIYFGAGRRQHSALAQWAVKGRCCLACLFLTWSALPYVRGLIPLPVAVQLADWQQLLECSLPPATVG